ncbi:NlpC/P60 family protein [Streptomyces sp. NPDC059909]|uniref:C40 family peptidase n=1 Tax=Streptomyces sp. NPDC059909 TaxID=3346998 RepID=UPI0036667174
MSGRLLRTICTTALAAATALASTTATAPAPAAEPKRIAALLTELQQLYRLAEEAGEAYNASEERLTAQRAETKRLGVELAEARNALYRGRSDAGRLARQQYRGSSALSDYLQLLLSRSPQQALDQGHLMERAARDRLATIARLERGEIRADELATRSRQALDAQQTLAEARRERRDAAQARLKELEELLTSLTADELTELAALERTGAREAQTELLDTGVLDGPRAPSEEGGEALEYAVEQVGKPYGPGAEGPESFDSSGLVSRAWAAAGRAIPRTSQEQWARLPKVPLRSLRPGDLVVYFPKATHVAIYLGDGQVVQARPGTRVKVSPVASNPLLGAVRPDPGAASLSGYTPPELPEIPDVPPGTAGEAGEAGEERPLPGRPTASRHAPHGTSPR